jgi:hypothetical protein
MGKSHGKMGSRSGNEESERRAVCCYYLNVRPRRPRQLSPDFPPPSPASSAVRQYANPGTYQNKSSQEQV